MSPPRTGEDKRCGTDDLRQAIKTKRRGDRGRTEDRSAKIIR